MPKLTLADGTTFTGESFGAACDADGEVVFNTGMVGYPESLTDPSYRGQILVFTYPLIGNYGVPSEELNEYGFSKNFESEAIQVRGVICAQVSEVFSHHKAEQSLPDWLKKHGIPGITGVDTRALTKKLREHGVMLGRLSSIEAQSAEVRGSEAENSGSFSPPADLSLEALRSRAKWEGRHSKKAEIEDPNKRNLVAEVSCKEVIKYEPKDVVPPFVRPQDDTTTIVAYDCGMKRNIIRSFLKRGVTVIRVPWNFDLSSADFKYDGVFISNGPGDPKMCKETIKQIQWAMEKEIPTFGICLGNQLLALAIGGDTYKLKYGHRGANQPCLKVSNSSNSDRCIITSQNHGFAVSDDLPKGWHVWWKNANDGTVEGIRHESGKFFSVQFHPEATPGPEDAGELFDEFLGVLGKRELVAE